MQVLVPMEKIKDIDVNVLNRLSFVNISIADIIQNVLNYALKTARPNHFNQFVCAGDSCANKDIMDDVDHDDIDDRILEVNIPRVDKVFIMRDIHHLSLIVYIALRPYINELFKYTRTMFQTLMFEYVLDVIDIFPEYFVIKISKSSSYRTILK